MNVPVKAKILKPFRVECLGPVSLKKQHWFWSESKYLRLCPKCTELVKRITIPPVYQPGPSE